MPVSRERQPWPMKWIVLTIAVGLVTYTYLTLHYRKTGPVYRPYEDIKSRANTKRLIAAGYQRVPLSAQRPADPTSPGTTATISSAPGGIPAKLRATLLDQPLLPAEIVRVSAAPAVNALLAYPIQFVCTLPDHHRQFAGAELYVKDGALFIVPTFELLRGELLARTADSTVLLTVPAGALKAGRYEATVVGERASKTWAVQVR